MKKNLTIEEIKNWLLAHTKGDPNQNFFYPAEFDGQMPTGNVFNYYYKNVNLNDYPCARAFKEVVRLDLKRTENRHIDFPGGYPTQELLDLLKLFKFLS